MLNAAPRSRVTLGSTTITYLPDGEVHLDPTVFFPASAPDGWSAYAPYLDDDGRLPISVGSFLVRTPTHRVLVDLGLGAVDFDIPGMGSFTGGRLIDSLAAEDLHPSDIDTVVFTHLHHDHVGWTTDHAPAPNAVHSGSPTGLTFDRARHVVDRSEWEFWNGSAELTGPDPEAVQKPLSPVVQFLDRGEPIVPGVRAIPTAGHTPGHTSLLVTAPDSDERVLILGDVMHTQAQVSETHWNFRFDVDPKLGRKHASGCSTTTTTSVRPSPEAISRGTSSATSCRQDCSIAGPPLPSEPSLGYRPAQPVSATAQSARGPAWRTSTVS